MNYRKAVEERKSIREFDKKDITEKTISDIRACFKDIKRLSDTIKTEFIIINGAEFQYLNGHAGYSGKTFEASTYLLLLSEVKSGYLENAGYINEDMILRLTEMGLDSCWLTVNEEPDLKKLLGIESDMKITAAIAVGYGKKERKLFSLHIKTMSNVDVITRDGHIAPKISLTHMVYGDTWGKPADLDEQYVDDGLRDALYAASYAPSFLNRQPFRFIMKAGTLVYVKMMDSLTGEFDARLNCGAVMLNFAAVLAESRPIKVEWVLGKPDFDCELPVDCEVVGYCKL